VLRFILRNHRLDSANGLRTDGFFTLDLEVPELERVLIDGGCGESGYDYSEFVGCEIIEGSARDPLEVETGLVVGGPK